MEITPDLATIHSYLCADGYVVQNLPSQKIKYYRIGLRNTNETLLTDFQDKFERTFGIKPHIRKSKDRCEIGSKKIYTNLINLFGSFRSQEWKMLTNLDKACAVAWIRAFFDCEGWVQARKAKSRSVSAESINYSGLTQIQETLKAKFNIESKIRKRKNRSTWTLDIFGKENLIKFNEQIGFLHEVKQEKLVQAVNSYMDYDWHLSENNTEKCIRELMLAKAKVKKPKTIRVSSIIKENLDLLSKYLTELFEIPSRVYGPWTNSSGSEYYELYIYDQISREKLIKLGLLSDKQIRKWQKK